jgi:type 1 glutamine amidotransferase
MVANGRNVGFVQESSSHPSPSKGIAMLKHRHFVHGLLLAATLAGAVCAEKIPYAKTEIVPPTPEWSAEVTKNAPAKPTAEAPKRKLLVFSLRTGYDHKVMPHVDRVFQILGESSGAFETTFTVDIEKLAPESLASYHVLVLNNNCSKGPRRNLLLDELESNPKYQDMTEQDRQGKSDALEQSMLEFVAGGKGLVVIHGAPTMLNNSSEFTEMVGAAFDYHPPNQEVTVRVVDEKHPLVAAFCCKGPFIHRDEPYCFSGPYEKLDFRPLLSMDVEGLKDPKGRVGDIVRYVAWIKPHGNGRVFYCSPGHFPESYLSPTLLRFLLDGVQYAAGDLKCDDSTRRFSG